MFNSYGYFMYFDHQYENYSCKIFIIFSIAIVCAVKCCSAASKLKGISFNISALLAIWVGETIRMASTSKRNSAGTKFLVQKFVISKVVRWSILS